MKNVLFLAFVTNVCQGFVNEDGTTDPYSLDITANLVGGSENSNGAWGRLDLTVNGVYGAVAPAVYNQNSRSGHTHEWTSSESIVACRHLGLKDVIATMVTTDELSSELFEYTPTTKFHITECIGFEEALSECNVTMIRDSYHEPASRNIILYCYLKEEALQVVEVPGSELADKPGSEFKLRSEFIGNVRIQPYYGPCDQFSCGSYPSYSVRETNAKVLCRTANKPYALTRQSYHSSWGDDEYGRPKISIGYMCSGHESNIYECPYAFNYWKVSETSLIVCSDDVEIKINRGELSATINSADYSLGGVDWDDAAAAVVCRTQGIKGTASIGSYVFFSVTNPKLEAEDFLCQGNEVNIFECSKSGAFAIGYDGDFYQTISVKCGGRKPKVALTLSSETSNIGRVQASVDGMLGTVCDYGWNEKAARVSCNMMGQTSGQVIALLDASAQGLGEIEEYEFTWVRYTYCKGDEKHLWDCLGDVYPYEASPCPGDHLAGIVCDVTKTGIQVSLAGGSHPGEGRVVVTIDGVAGSIGWQDWDDKDARVICKMMGFTNNSISAVASSQSGFATIKGPLYFDDVPCTGKENHLLDCYEGRSGWTTKKGSEDLVAGVICTTDLGYEANKFIAESGSNYFVIATGVLAAILLITSVVIIVFVVIYCRKKTVPEKDPSETPSRLEMAAPPGLEQSGAKGSDDQASV